MLRSSRRLPVLQDVHGDIVRRVAAEALAEVPREAAAAGRREDLAVRPHEVLVAARGGELVDVAECGFGAKVYESRCDFRGECTRFNFIPDYVDIHGCPCSQQNPETGAMAVMERDL